MAFCIICHPGAGLPIGKYHQIIQTKFLQTIFRSMKKLHLIILLAMIAGTALDAQTAKEIIAKSEAQMNGESSYSEMKMTIIRPKWTREMTMKSWAIGTDYSLILVTGPARDKGIGFLKGKRDLELAAQNRSGDQDASQYDDAELDGFRL